MYESIMVQVLRILLASHPNTHLQSFNKVGPDISFNILFYMLSLPGEAWDRPNSGQTNNHYYIQLQLLNFLGDNQLINVK